MIIGVDDGVHGNSRGGIGEKSNKTNKTSMVSKRGKDGWPNIFLCTAV